MSRIIKRNEDDFKMKSNATYKITYFFTVILLTVFPLFYRDFYYDILPAKYMFYYNTVLLMAVCVAFSLIVAAVKNKNMNYAENRRQILKAVTAPDICMFILIVAVVISTLQSDFKFESIWGNEARYNGLFLWLIYSLAYVVITRYLKFKINLMDWFLSAGILVCLFGITDYFGMDILHFKVNMRESQRDIFTSTFGNINVYTAYVGMVSAVAVTLYATAKNKGKMAFYYITSVISFIAMIMGRSDNGYLALGAILAALPFYLFTTRTGVKRYIICIATLFTSIWCIRIVNGIWPDWVMELDSVFGIMSRSDKLIYGVLGIWILIAVLCVWNRRNIGKGETLGNLPRYIWGIFVCICLAVVFYVLYDANIAGNGARYGGLENYVVFNDQWGTDRGFVWKLSVNHFKDFSITRKLFGYGPDTFGLLTHYYDMDAMLDYNNIVFESAHNEYLHYLLTIGLLGTTAYVGLLATACYRIVKKAGENPYAVATVFAVIAYAAQAAVNIAQPLITPIMFTLMMIGLAACNDKSRKVIDQSP